MSIDFVLYVLAFVLLILETAGVPYRLGWAGLAAFVLTFLV